MTKTVLVTGASSGIGEAAVKLFAAKGWNVFATMRKPTCDAGVKLAALPNVVVDALDVTDTVSIERAVKAAISRFSALDVVVNNAGYALGGPVEFASDDQVMRQYDTNVIGVVRVMRAVLPHMRERCDGTIINVTSVGGRTTTPFFGLYQGTKYAVEAISESAAMELKPLGVRVKIVEPGAVKTNFVNVGMQMTSSNDVKAYDEMMQNMTALFPAILAAGSEPMDTAAVIYEAATDESDRLRFLAGEDAKAMLKTRATISDEEHINNSVKMLLPEAK